MYYCTIFFSTKRRGDLFFFCPPPPSSSSKGLVVSRRRRIYYFGFSRAHTWTPPCAPSSRSRNYGKTVRLVYRAMSPLSPASGYDVCRLMYFFILFPQKKKTILQLYIVRRVVIITLYFYPCVCDAVYGKKRDTVF